MTRFDDVGTSESLRLKIESQHASTYTRQQEALLATLDSHRQAAADELWDLETRARKTLYEELEDLSEGLQRADAKLEEYVSSQRGLPNSLTIELYKCTNARFC